VIDDPLHTMAAEHESFAEDIDDLIRVLDARAAIEIGIAQLLRTSLAEEPELHALVCRLRSFIPLVRGASPGQIARYIRTDDAYHRHFLSLLRNPCLFQIYNALDVPELLRRVLTLAPRSTREAFDNHRALTAALRSNNGDQMSAAIVANANRIHAALTALASDVEREQQVVA
jgi:DNA-binding GntR family transcriptional regulator